MCPHNHASTILSTARMDPAPDSLRLLSECAVADRPDYFIRVSDAGVS
jgi:hypothetical protein